MIGRFLEFGLRTDRILDSIGFYEELGFCQLSAGDIWQHPYAVMSDGNIDIGLHAAPLPAPMITFVMPDLAGELFEFRSRGVDFLTAETGDERFNELVFADPDGNHVRILEARTFSPAPFDNIESVCGRFREISLPVRDRDDATAFWCRLDFEELGRTDDPHPHVWLRGGGIVLGLHQSRDIDRPSLSFQADNLSARLTKLRRIGIPAGRGHAPTGVTAIESPEGVPILLHGI